MNGYRRYPLDTDALPPGLTHIVVSEAAERFSFYGMRAILVLFMTRYLLDSSGQLAPMEEAEATFWYHQFMTAVYAAPFLGALLADGWWGKYRTIVTLALVYCAGHLTLVLNDTRSGLALGLGLIAIGAGGIKPCVSAHLGDQFGSRNKSRLPAAYGAFYFAINLGALASVLIAQALLERFGSPVAFGLPGVLMFVATVVFWLGRHKFAHIPPAGPGFARVLASPTDGIRALTPLIPIYLVIAVFWSLFDQQGSRWVLQAQHMDRHWIVEWGEAQIQWLNPALILLLIPLFSGVIYPRVGRVITLTPLRKIGTGLFIASSSFVVSAWIEHRLATGYSVNIAWQFVTYVLITVGEIMVSITGLEFSYTQAPPRLKALVTSAFLLTVAVGNQFTGWVNYFIQRPDGSLRLNGEQYYMLFAAAMFIAACVFVPVARRYKMQHWRPSMVPPA